jgi:type VI secretion system VasI family protein
MRNFVIASAIALLSTLPAAAWTASVETNPIDDSRSVALMLDASDSYTNRYGRSGQANLQIVCQQNRTGLALVLPELYTSNTGGLGEVTLRVDSKPAFERDMIAANDRGSLAVIGGPAISAIKEMLGGERLIMQFLTVSEPTKIVTFDITGLDDVIGDVRETCGW